MTNAYETPEPATGGWLRATRHALGLSLEQMAAILNIREANLRQRFERGTEDIPPGMRRDVHKFVEFTDACVDSLRVRAEQNAQPAIVVYTGRHELPDRHIAALYGLDWWDHVAFSVAKLVPDVMIGYPWEIAAAYDYAAGDIDRIHTDPDIFALYRVTPDADPLRSGAQIA
jgi:transcriptional regulator with XRE-family HTH domain